MSNTSTNAVPIKLEPQTFAQNGAELRYVPDTIKKGTSVGKPILRPELKGVPFEIKAKFVGGMDIVEKLIDRIISGDAAEASRNSINKDTESIDLDKWRNEIAGINTAGETIDELCERLEDVHKDQSDWAEQLIEASVKGDVEKIQSIRTEMLKLKEERASLEKTIEEKREIGRKRVASRKANEAAKEVTEAAEATAA